MENVFVAFLCAGNGSVLKEKFRYGGNFFGVGINLN